MKDYGSTQPGKIASAMISINEILQAAGVRGLVIRNKLAIHAGMFRSDRTDQGDSSSPGTIVRSLRRRRGPAQQQLAELSTFSVRAMRDIDPGGVATPRLQTIRLVADAMRLDRTSAERLESATLRFEELPEERLGRRPA